MDQERQRLLALIEAAFAGVELGDGVSLHETVVIDDYGSGEERQAARKPDEKHDWRRLIDDPELVRICAIGGLSFYDSVGLRFHLPAYLSLAVIGVDQAYAKLESMGIQCAEEVIDCLAYALTDFSEYNLKRLSILNDAQRKCVCEVLDFLASEGEEGELGVYYSGLVRKAITNYWHSGQRWHSKARPQNSSEGIE